MKSLKSLLFLIGLHATAVYADSLSVITGKAVDSNLIDLPVKAIKGNLDFENHQMIGLAYQKSITHPSFIQKSLDFINVDGAQSHIELMAIQHHANSPNYAILENVVAYQINSRRFENDWATLRLGLSIGLSYVYGTPVFEDGEKNNPGKKYRLLNYNAYEISVWNKKEDFGGFFRVHHRSGMYGLIAPQGVGSNFLSIGLRHAWK